MEIEFDISEMMSTDELERTLDALAQRLYKEHRGFVPMYPWILLRTLPRAQQPFGTIWLPEKDQNKTVLEGIVLRSWDSHACPAKNEHDIWYEHSDLKPGDHVLFPHWSGLPIPGYNEHQYRIVREHGDGCIFAKVEVESDPAQKLLEIMHESPSTLRDMVSEIQERFILVDRGEHSVTLSGK